MIYAAWSVTPKLALMMIISSKTHQSRQLIKIAGAPRVMYDFTPSQPSERESIKKTAS
jgi:hypothetical protein